ncbi:MAG: hypothetical protein IJV71_12105 [Lachnospiraceae bacterium]|nr:hypothetical protein [Lachnospiraceae bacterium]
MKLKEFLKRLRQPVEIRLTIGGRFLCNTTSQSEILSFYENYEVKDFELHGSVARDFRSGVEIDLQEANNE